MEWTEPKTDLDVLARLAHPFRNVKRRRGEGGQDFEYIDPYMVMNRLDDACGPAHWGARHRLAGDAVSCRITILLPSGRRVSRGQASAITPKVDRHGKPEPRSKSIKTAYSDAFKKAAEQWGVGRYLKTGGQMPAYYRRWQARAASPPPPPIDAGTGKTSEPPEEHEFRHRGGPTGPGVELYKELFTLKDRAVWFDCARDYARRLGFPAKIRDWTPHQVAQFRLETGLADQGRALEAAPASRAEPDGTSRPGGDDESGPD